MDAARLSHSRKGLAISVVVVTAAFFGLVLTAPNVAAQDVYVSGPISADTTWLSTNAYFVTGHVTVKAGVTLRIEPGTVVRFDAGRGLFIEGTLWADGFATNLIQFLPNASFLPFTWYGVQFNASSTGSVSWSSFVRPDRAVAAIDSSPPITNNSVQGASWGFALVRSATVLADNVVDRAALGIYLAESDAQVLRNQVNATTVFGIRAETSGAPTITGNTITDVRGGFAVGIYASGVSPYISGNWIQGIFGRDGPNGVGSGSPGEDGGFAIGILVDGGSSATVVSNMIDSLFGGRGGNGAANTGSMGGRGGNGGPGAGIVVANVGTADVDWNSVTNVSGGRGGTGGQGSSTSTGGAGGDAGDAAAIEVINAATAAWYYGNYANMIVGGIGGHGGDGTSVDGFGGPGGDALGILSWAAMNADASGNWVVNLRGGLGGNSTPLGGGNRPAGAGGPATAIALFGPAGSSIVHANTLLALSGGDGGRGSPGGGGGDGTGVLVFGNADGNFNATSTTSNWIESIAGGGGGIGPSRGGEGGSAMGIGAALVTASVASNALVVLRGGTGGDGVVGGRGGDAMGIAGILVRGSSFGDYVDTVTKGSPGSPPPAEVAFGIGYFLEGNASVRTGFTINNATIANVGDYDFFAGNYANGTTINTTVAAGRLRVEPAGNLTVENFLGVDAFWPNGITLVAGASILVEDNGASAWNIVSASGSERWLLVTDRVYINSDVATENATSVRVTYAAYSFQNSPRSANMATTHTEIFVMIDVDAPTSKVGALPTYMTTLTFTVSYTATDGNGGGLGNVTLWYRRDGAGWTRYATQPAGNAGNFSFTTSADGTYEFKTIAEDLAGNVERGPNANDTWTIVDTIRPGSHVDALPQYETTNSFLVTWAPDAGVTDIVTYTIQYNAGATWVDWLVDTTATSGTFSPGVQGVFAFRSIAKDAAGNPEVAPADNDTWTIVDTFRPFSRALPLSAYQTSMSFVVSWGPQFDTTDIASYRLEVRDNGGSWTEWIPLTTATSSTFGGQDGHTYEFRSIATDRAGNVEFVTSANDSWTLVDVTPPDAVMTALPAYVSALQFTISWGPATGILDVASYRIQWKDGPGAWTDLAGYSDTTATSATFVGQDGHVYAFRTMARDRAGNWESTPAGNDTWTVVDVTRPFVIDSEPVGANTNTTPAIVIMFSEPMDRNSAELAFSITPSINGVRSWSADSRVMTFTPARELQAGTTYFVVVGTNARDLAGNGMLQSLTFQFSTASVGFTLSDFWWVLLVVGAVVGGAFFLIMRRRSASGLKPPAAAPAAKPSEAILEDVFLLSHRDGILIKHETRRLRPDIDTDILSGMLTAVQQFVKDALRGDDYAELNEMTVGHMHILIGRGKWLVLAARIEGDGTETWTGQIQRCIEDMETHHWDQLEDWDGDMALAGVLAPYVKKLIRGEYA